MPIRSAVSSRPPPGTPVEWSRPLSQGLLCFHPFNEGGGMLANDAAGNLPLPGVNYNSSPWTAGPYGTGLLKPLVAAAFQATLPAAMQPNWPMTLACGVRFSAVGGVTSARVYGAQPNNTNATPYVALTFYLTASALAVGIANGATPVTPLVSAAYAANADYVFAVTVTPAAWQFYVNGVLNNSGSGTYAKPAWAATAQMTAAGWIAANSSPAVAPLYWGAWWGRALSAAEHAAIGASPAAIHGLLLGQPGAFRLIANPPPPALALSRRTLYGRAGSRGVA